MATLKESIPDAELQVLKLLWAAESMTARELAEAIYSAADNSTLGTVHKLLQRLEKKGCVKRDRSQFDHRFSAKATQTAVAGWHLESIARKVADGSLAPFITHLVQVSCVSRTLSFKNVLEFSTHRKEKLDVEKKAFNA